jgi:hypothetical protein
MELKDELENEIFIGGDITTIRVTATIDGKEYKTDPLLDKFTILGNSDRITDAYADLSDFTRAVMYRESRYRQFSVTNEYPNKEKYPLVNLNYNDAGYITTIDRGIMQINSLHEYDAIPFELKHVWSWKENKAYGLRLLSEAKNAASAWPKKIKENTVDIDYYEGWFDKDGYRGCPETFGEDDNEYIWKETYRRYNGGTGFAYWTWKPNDLKDPDKGGSWGKIVYANKKDPKKHDKRNDAAQYADEVWGFTQNKPVDW